MKIIYFKNQCQPDPYIIEYKGIYYIYCTGKDGVYCYKSDNLFSNWELVGAVLKDDKQKNYWAPSVIENNGIFYMYYSSMDIDDDNEHHECIKVATSPTPYGPFTYIRTLIEPFSIDAHVVKNDDGLYIFYSINRYEGRRIGTYIVCDKMNDFYHVSHHPRPVVVPTIDEEINTDSAPINGKKWHTVEGAFYFKEGDYHYLIYSGSSYLKHEYHLGYAVSKSKSNLLDKIKYKKVSNKRHFLPLLQEDENETSTGHNSLIKVDNKYYVIYHGRDYGSTYSRDLNYDDRTARICELVVDNGKLTIKRI